MNNIIIPDIDKMPLPAPMHFLQTFQIIFFILHIIPVNFLLGGSLICLFSEIFRANNDYNKILTRKLVAILPVVIAYVVLFGVGTLLFTQVIYGQFFYTSSIIIAVPWIFIIFLVIIGYYGLYLRNFLSDKLGKLDILIGSLIAVIFLIVAFIYINNSTLMLTPEKWYGMYFNNPYGVNLNLKEATLIPRYFHFILAGISVAGLLIIWYGVFSKQDSNYSKWVINYGIIWLVIPTIAQIFVGIWFLLSLPGAIMNTFLGGKISNTIILGSGILSGVISMVLFFSARNKEKQKLKIIAGTLSLLLTIVFMAITRHNLRMEYLSNYFQYNREVSTQTGAIILFLFTFFIGIFIISYMLRKTFLAPTEQRK